MDRDELWRLLSASIENNYAEMLDNWLSLSPAALVDEAEGIAAAKLMYLNARYCVRDEDIPQLLRLKNPLEFLVDTWQEGIDGTILEMQDRVDYAIDHDALDDYEQEDDSPTMQME